MYDYDKLKQKTIYYSEWMSKFLEDAYKERLKKGYIPFSIFVGQLTEEWKDKICQ